MHILNRFVSYLILGLLNSFQYVKCSILFKAVLPVAWAAQGVCCKAPWTEYKGWPLFPCTSLPLVRSLTVSHLIPPVRVNIMTAQRKHLQEPKVRCALCSAWGIPGFPAKDLDWHRMSQPSDWVISSCWHGPWAAHGHAAVEVMPCWAAGPVFLPSVQRPWTWAAALRLISCLSDTSLTPQQNKCSKWEQKHQENLKPVSAFKENLHRYFELKGIMMWLFYLKQLFYIAFAKSCRRDCRLIGVFWSEIKNKEANLYLCSKGFPTAEIFLLYRGEGKARVQPLGSKQTDTILVRFVALCN